MIDLRTLPVLPYFATATLNHVPGKVTRIELPALNQPYVISFFPRSTAAKLLCASTAIVDGGDATGPYATLLANVPTELDLPTAGGQQLYLYSDTPDPIVEIVIGTAGP